MDKLKALSLLGLPADALEDAILSAYRQRVTDLKMQLSNAPAPMKPVYEKNLAETEAAFQALSAGSHDWLPSAERVNAKNTPVGIPAVRGEQANGDNSKQATASGGFLQTSNKWLFAITLLSLAAAAFFGVQWSKMNNEIKEMVGQGSVESLKKSLEGGEFTIENAGEESIYIIAYAVAYFDFTTGEMKTYPKSYKEGEYKEIKPGGNLKTKHVEGNDVVFPGTAFLYTIVYGNREGVPGILSGTLKKGQPVQINI